MSSQEGPLREIEPQLKGIQFERVYVDTLLGPIDFIGNATLDVRTGQFIGRITDGERMVQEEADIVGELIGPRLCFVKLYDRESINPYPINYEFERRGGTWHGMYSFGPMERSRGKTLCNILDDIVYFDDFEQRSEIISRKIAQRREEIAERLRSTSEES